jgi:hypothetical protein
VFAVLLLSVAPGLSEELFDTMNDGIPLDAEELRDTYADFLTRAVSSEANSLVDDLTQQAVAWEAERKRGDNQRASVRGSYKRGEKRLASLQNGLGRFIGNLLHAEGDPQRTGKVFRSLKKDTFTSAPVSFDTFEVVWKALEARGQLTRIPGTQRWHPIGFDNKPIQLSGTASIFQPTQKLLKLAQEHGVCLENIDRHFVRDRGALELRSHSKWEWSPKSDNEVGYAPRKVGGHRVQFTPDERTKLLEAQVKSINEFLRTFSFKGGKCSGFYRGFNQGMDPGAFNWNKGGRLYAYGQDSYQSLTGDQRARITINDEPTVEIDVSASYLTIYHGLIKERFDTQSGGVWDRVIIDNKLVAKDWINLSLTTGKRMKKWPKTKIREYRTKYGIELDADHPVGGVKAASLTAFPALYKLEGSGLTWAELMFEEAEVILTTMLKLMDRGVPSLPVFDSIIVPQSQVRLATGELYDAFYQRIGKKPLLKTKSELPGVKEAIRAATDDDERWVNAVDL